MTGYGLSYSQYDSGEAGGGRGGGGEEGEAGEAAAAAARSGCLGGPDVTSGPGAVAVEDEAATGGRGLQRQAELAGACVCVHVCHFKVHDGNGGFTDRE